MNIEAFMRVMDSLPDNFDIAIRPVNTSRTDFAIKMEATDCAHEELTTCDEETAMAWLKVQTAL